MKALRIVLLGVLALSVARELSASTETIGQDGINSKGTTLTGAGATIGQVERLRSGKAGFDTDVMKHHDQTIPFQVQRGITNDSANSGLVGDHATEVAGVMIAKAVGLGSTPDASLEGVAPEAMLFSASGQPPATGDLPNLALAMQDLADMDDMLAINLSFGGFEGPSGTDGNSFISKFVDWSS